MNINLCRNNKIKPVSPVPILIPSELTSNAVISSECLVKCLEINIFFSNEKNKKFK